MKMKAERMMEQADFSSLSRIKDSLKEQLLQQQARQNQISSVYRYSGLASELLADDDLDEVVAAAGQSQQAAMENKFFHRNDAVKLPGAESNVYITRSPGHRRDPSKM